MPQSQLTAAEISKKLMEDGQRAWEKKSLADALGQESADLFVNHIVEAIRGPRTAWFSAWHVVAEAALNGSVPDAVRGLEQAKDALRPIKVAIDNWRSLVQDFRSRLPAEYANIKELIHGVTEAMLSEGLTDWAVSAYDQRWPDDFVLKVTKACSQIPQTKHVASILAMVIGGEAEENLQRFLHWTEGPTWLRGLTAACALMVIPAPADWIFSPTDLPSEGDHDTAKSLLFLGWILGMDSESCYRIALAKISPQPHPPESVETQDATQTQTPPITGSRPDIDRGIGEFGGLG